MSQLIRRALLSIVAVAVAVLAAVPAAVAVTPEPYRENDYLGFRNILPPGSNGTENGSDASQFLCCGTFPSHWVDQAPLYENLVYNAPGLTPAQIPQFFKDGSFGVPAGGVERTYSPTLNSNVVIQRDKKFGVPHVYGATRADTIYGAGYVSAEDRLFFMDVLRHAGRAQLSGFAGGSNRAMDEDVWQIAPYTEADLQKQADQLDDLYGSDGVQIQNDAQAYINGINAYITEARLNPATKMPAEYAALGQSVQDFQPTDIIATASLVGGIFGKGGGGELANALVLQAAQNKFGPTTGKAVWGDFRRNEDPEAPTTVRGTAFPYQAGGVIKPDAVAMPDPGSIITESGASASASSAELGAASPIEGGLADGLELESGNSNALLVSGSKSSSGKPVAVMGPQVAYFIPEILNEMDLHCAGDCGADLDIDARGAAFPGISPYVLLGRGQDYAWSATSAGQDIIDTFAEELCNPATLNSTNYRYKGQCVPMETLERTNVVTPNPSDPCGGAGEPACGPFTMTSRRTVHGIVTARGTVGGKPVAFAKQRSTYMHEVDSARSFVDLNSPDRIQNAQDFQQAMYKTGFTFNWFYADDRDIAYFNSGDNPVRATGTDPNFPTWGTGKYDWQGFNAANRTATYTPFSQHPRVINQSYITSWNNKQAPQYRAAEDNYAYGPVFRSQSLDRRIDSVLNGGGKFTLAKLIDAMEDAGTVDLRGSEVLPYMLDVIGTPSNPALADAVQRLRMWINSGAHRRDRDNNGVYDNSRAVQIMDAWWSRALEAAFKPAMGQALFDSVRNVMGFDDDPHGGSGSHVGSAYISGWYGYLQKDLRSLLGRPVTGAYSRRYCGNGSLSACRTALTQSLQAAIAVPREQLYDEDPGSAGVQRVNGCPDGKGDQWCWDSVRFRPIGAVTYPTIHWINRPTWQQAVGILGHRPR
jgi:acyl-homoserine lactone acylase PvdQ